MKRILLSCLVSAFLSAQEPIVLDLASALEIALTYNQTLQEADENLRKAQIGVMLAESEFHIKISPRGDIGYTGGGRAGYGGTIGGGVDIKKRFAYGTVLTISPAIIKASHEYQSLIQASLTQPLFRGFGREYTLSPVYSSMYGWRTAQRMQYLAEVNLMMQVILSVYDVVREENLVRIDEESATRLRSFKDATKAKESIGLSDALDVFRAESELNLAQEALNGSLDRYQMAKEKLTEILGLEPNQEFTIKASLEYHENTLPFDNAVEIALSQRIELDQAQDQNENASRLTFIAKENIRPELNLVLDYTSSARDEVFTETWSNKRENKWGIGFTTSTSLDRTREIAAYEESLIGEAAAKRAYLISQNNIILDIKKIYRQLSRAKEKIELQNKQVKTAEGELRLAKVKFDRGLANNFDLIQAEKRHRQAQGTYISAVIDYKVGEFKLLHALGRLAAKPECQ